MNANETKQIPSTEGNNSSVKKIPLSEYVGFETTNRYVQIFKVDKETVKRNGGKVWIGTNHKTNYQRDEIVVESFEIFGQSHTSLGVSMEIDEETLEKMLEFVRSKKKKVYCMEGSN